MSGKGSGRRPSQIGAEEEALRWRLFACKDEEEKVNLLAQLNIILKEKVNGSIKLQEGRKENNTGDD